MRALAVAAALAGAGPAMGEAADVPGVFPSGPELPENALRVSLAFAAPPGPGVLPRLTLAGDLRAPGHGVFLDQELWSPDGRRLTVLFDPGRVKTGTAANARFGRPLREGSEVTLALDGRPIKRWHVSAPILAGPQPARWTIAAPAAGSTAPLVVSLAEPVDDLDADMIAVAAPDGTRLAGAAALGAGETVWSFVPDSPWRPGAYRLVVDPALEDAAGNAVAQAFEFRQADTQPGGHASTSRPFAVR